MFYRHFLIFVLQFFILGYCPQRLPTSSYESSVWVIDGSSLKVGNTNSSSENRMPNNLPIPCVFFIVHQFNDALTEHVSCNIPHLGLFVQCSRIIVVQFGDPACMASCSLNGVRYFFAFLLLLRELSALSKKGNTSASFRQQRLLVIFTDGSPHIEVPIGAGAMFVAAIWPLLPSMSTLLGN
jgi:hypothetical protein